MEYFGTNLRCAGHYRWVLNRESFPYENTLDVSDLPFHPEKLTYGLKKGETSFLNIEGYTVLAISGSPVDQRGGTKSVFWVKKEISRNEMINEIMSNPLGKKIIEQMPFEVKWNDPLSRHIA